MGEGSSTSSPPPDWREGRYRAPTKPASRTVAPLVSIVTPTLNQGRFIEQTIKSLLAQTYTDFEHIVVDGGSTDDTHAILRAYESRYPLRWITGSDEGMYDAINKGLALAQGRVHAYLNSDDLYFPWTLEVVADLLQARADVDIVCGDSINVDEATGDEHVRIVPGSQLERWITVLPVQQPATFWRREVTAGLGGFRAEFRYVGDWDFFIRARERYRFHKLDEFLAVERRHEASKTVGEADPMALENQRMLQGHRKATREERFLSARALAARRITWLRFLSEVIRPTQDETRPWGRLLGSGSVSINVPRLLAGLIPQTPYEWKVGAVRTGRDWLSPG